MSGRQRRSPTVLCLAVGLAALLAAGAPKATLGAAMPAPTAADPPIIAGLAGAHLPEPLVSTGPTNAAEDAALLQAVAAMGAPRRPGRFFQPDRVSHGPPAFRLAGRGIDRSRHRLPALRLFLARPRRLGDGVARGQGATDPHARALVDRAVGELMQLQARLGHKERLAALLTRSATGRSAVRPRRC